jgi:hypothetical protein
MSSFLTPSVDSWTKVIRSTEVEVVTLDAFAAREGLGFIHALKSDTQGFDFEVFQGARGLMESGRIGVVYFEITFSQMYENLPPFDALYRYLVDHDFALVSFYKSYYQRDRLGWTDALFIHRGYQQSRIERGLAAAE